MKRLYNAAAAVRSTLLCQGGNRTVAAARHMDPILCSALAEAVKDDCLCQADLDEIETELAQAVTNLQVAVEKEKFLGLRSRQYRKKLDAQARALHDEREALLLHTAVGSSSGGDVDGGGDDEEEAAVQKQLLADWESRMEQWEKEEDALKSIQETHKQIIAACEQMRRTICDLTKKKEAVGRLNDQCQDFLAVAAAIKLPTTTADLELTTVTTSMEEGAVTEENEFEAVVPSSDEEFAQPEIPDLQHDEEVIQVDSDTAVVTIVSSEQMEEPNEAESSGDASKHGNAKITVDAEEEDQTHDVKDER